MRLTSEIWIAAYRRRLELAGIPAFVVRRGDASAGAVLVKLATLDGRATVYQRAVDPATGGRNWMALTEGAEAEVDAAIARQTGRDPDLWVIELEDRLGRHLLDEEGLSE